MVRYLGITGTFGAGKGEVVRYLLESHDDRFIHYSMRNMIIECAREYLDVAIIDRDGLRKYSNLLRKEHGPEVFVRRACERAGNSGTGAIIESVRCVGEVDFLQNYLGEHFTLIAIDADRHKRFERVTARGDFTDNVNFDEFCRQEDAELANTSPWEQNLQQCRNLASQVIMNNGSKEDLYRAIARML